MFHKKTSRRKFFKQAGCAAMGSTSLFSTLVHLGLTNALVTPAATSNCPDDYKALICIFLSGGNDSYNMLMPFNGTAYNNYATIRSGLAIPQNNLLPLGNSGNPDYAVHPAMPEVQQLYNDGNVAFVSNVGTLLEYVADVGEFNSGTKNIPFGIYSHGDQIQQWQTSLPQSRDSIGWGGRMADILKSCNSNQDISMNISLSGRNVFQAGNSVIEYAISNVGNGVSTVPVTTGYNNGGFLDRIRNTAVENLMSSTYSNVFQDTYTNLTNASLAVQGEFSQALAQVEPFTNAFTDAFFNNNFGNSLARDLHMIARTIAARDTIGMKRQIFFIDYGTWDNHDELLQSHNFLLTEVSQALGEFYTALEEIGMQDKVTAFTASDFARTLTSNGNGTDHSWGGNHLVMGGAVNGGQIYGNYPSLTLNNPLNIDGRGTFIPTTSTDEYFAELALWFGISPGNLEEVVPNIGNFYSPGSPNHPLGFLPSV